MGDPTRIVRITDKLAALWSTQPDIRLGQLIFNVSFVSDRERDLYNFEDALMEKTLDAAMVIAGLAPEKFSRSDDVTKSRAVVIHDGMAEQVPHLGYMRHAGAHMRDCDVARAEID